ncbi:MAG TPA: tetratricopeptide repeat protein, partial [Actinomycetota bacterium]|nr:tetratricopeptide repeat protein [Actinomycetota bacterium]
GDAVNLAARLMAKAEPGQVLTTGDVLHRSRAVFDCQPLEPFVVKGKARPVHAFAVGEAGEQKRAQETSRSPLVGREAEVAALVAAVESARVGRGRLVDIVGEPGIGKSRLLEEVMARAPDIPFVVSACEPYTAARAYLPWHGMLRTLLSIEDDPDVGAEHLARVVAAVAPDLVPWLPLIAIPFGFDLEPTAETAQLEEQFRRPRLEEATLDLLTRAVGESVALVFEDTHWMDDPSCDLLERMAAGVRRLPWLLCVTRRETEGGFAPRPGPTVVRIDPKPLGADDAAALLRATSEDAPLRPHELEALAQRAGGNPLFLQELLASRSAVGVDELPDSVEAAIVARIDRLAARDRAVLRRVSVLGAAFERTLAGAVLDGTEDDQIWDRLAEFLDREDGVVRFRHALLRDSAYAGLPFRLRGELHGRVAERLEERAGAHAEDEAEVLALHFFNARRYEPAWRYARVAGERARGIYANVEAAGFYELALDSAKRLAGVSPSELVQTHEALGDVRQRVGEFERASAAYRAARRLVAGDSVAEARLYLKEADVARRAGTYPQTLRWLRRGHRALEGVLADPEAARQRARLTALYGSVRQDQGRSAEAIEWSLRAIEEAEQAGEREALARAHFILDRAYVSLGQLDLATHSAISLAIYEELGDLAGQANVLNNMGGFAYYQGQWNEAVDLYERGRRARDRTGDAVNAAFGTVNVGEILSDQGRLDEAEDVLREALRVWQAAGYTSGIAYALGQLGRTAYRAGRLEEGRRLLERSRRMSNRMGSALDTLEAEARLAECALFESEPISALRLADEALEQAAAVDGAAVLLPLLHRVRGFAWLQLAQTNNAKTSFETSLTEARAREADYEVALTLRALAEVADRTGDENAQALRIESNSILERLGVVFVPEFPLPASRGGPGTSGPAT